MKPVEEMNFEEAIGALEQLVGELDSGNVALEKSVELYQRGAALKAHCEKRLAEAELKIKEVTGKAGDTLATKPADDLI